MNPFSRFLRQWSQDKKFDQFVSYWDRLEFLTIQVYKEKVTLEAAAPEFEEVWPWLQAAYPQWQGDLQPYWQGTRAAGKPTELDPFQYLLNLTSPLEIQNNWTAMQYLPAAREALNQYLRAEPSS